MAASGKQLYMTNQSHSFFGTDWPTLKQILFLAEWAGPLDQFEFLIRKFAENIKDQNQKNLLMDEIFTFGDVQGTLVQLLVSRLDQTVSSYYGIEIDEGMAERFIKLVRELFPNRLADVLKQAQITAPLEDEKTKEAREASNVAALHHVFDAIKHNDEIITLCAIKTFKEFVKNTKLSIMNNNGCLADNRYYVNLIHLISAAFGILARRGSELPKTIEEDPGQWFGAKASLFCFEIIGLTLELDLPPRIKQILRSSLSNLLEFHKKVARHIDAGDELFRGVGTIYSLGINSYYDDRGRRGPVGLAAQGDAIFAPLYSGPLASLKGDTGGIACSIRFQNFLEAITTASKLYTTASYITSAVPGKVTR